MDVYALGIAFIAGIGFMIIISPVSDSHIASRLRPKITPKTDFNEMCGSCFSSMISKMPLSTICDLKEVERQRMIGCSHRTKAATPPLTTEYLGGNEPDFGVIPPEVDTRRTTG